MKDKKYYTISEVTKLLDIPASQLRYIEKILPNFVVTQLRGRRYYTATNIKIIKNKLLLANKNFNNYSKSETNTVDKNFIVDQIDNLIGKFNNLSIRLKNILAPSCSIN